MVEPIVQSTFGHDELGPAHQEMVDDTKTATTKMLHIWSDWLHGPEGQAGLHDGAVPGRDGVDVLSIYDDYPAMVLVQLEDLGFASAGVARLVTDGFGPGLVTPPPACSPRGCATFETCPGSGASRR